MFDVLSTILAVLLIVLLGYLMKRRRFLDRSVWDASSRLCYWVLFPGLLFNLTSQAELGSNFLAPFLLCLVLGAGAIVLFAFIYGRIAGLAGPQLSSVIQGSLRHNGFLALSILQGVGGLAALQIGGIGVAVLVPISNVVAVIVLFLCRDGAADHHMGTAIIKELVRNPLIGAVAIGSAVNWMDVSVPSFVTEMAGMLGAAALPLLLLSIGASLRFASLRSNMSALSGAFLAKVIVFPALLLGLAVFFRLDATALIVLAAIGAAPTASSSFALAKELGGDANLMAEIISLQTVVAALSMPVWIVVAQYLGDRI